MSELIGHLKQACWDRNTKQNNMTVVNETNALTAELASVEKLMVVGAMKEFLVYNSSDTNFINFSIWNKSGYRYGGVYRLDCNEVIIEDCDEQGNVAEYILHHMNKEI